MSLKLATGEHFVKPDNYTTHGQPMTLTFTKCERVSKKYSLIVFMLFILLKVRLQRLDDGLKTEMFHSILCFIYNPS